MASRHKDYSPQRPPRARGVPAQAGPGSRGGVGGAVISPVLGHNVLSPSQYRLLLGFCSFPPISGKGWSPGSRALRRTPAQRPGPELGTRSSRTRRALRGVTTDAYGCPLGRRGRGHARAAGPSGGALGGCSRQTVRRWPAGWVRGPAGGVGGRRRGRLMGGLLDLSLSVVQLQPPRRRWRPGCGRCGRS